jgi:hypothetical protein
VGVCARLWGCKQHEALKHFEEKEHSKCLSIYKEIVELVPDLVSAKINLGTLQVSCCMACTGAVCVIVELRLTPRPSDM